MAHGDRDPDEADLDLPVLDLPDAGSPDGDAPEAPLDDPPVSDAVAPTELDGSAPTEAADQLGALEAELDTIAEEPTVLGDDHDGLEHDELEDALDEEAGASFLGPDEREEGHDEDDALDALDAGDDDGGAEGVEDLEGEALEELPPLDGEHDDEERDDELGEPDELEVPGPSPR